ncbi:carbonic anhydrase [Tersicoccus solisilvae]|uniref:carbonic anhydrase n=1 Tax=Tersicoccus solisilvae TaxID=1882339 RepID=A0ABQ1P7B3_9MICC|nr:carbonic anhydrase [Tersicoccus solisilvae]GGC92591.1 carbonic anhydrase [Tersicoccus solisilvae]
MLAPVTSRPSPSGPVSPAEAWQRLADGNRRFVAGRSNHPNQDAARRTALVNAQHPFAVIFGCSDSRLAAEIIFDVGLGDVFVIRTAGQVIDDAVLGSLEYSIAVLGVPLIVILGHDSCGAVTATRDAVDSGQMPAGFIRDLVERITPSVLTAKREGHDDLTAMIDEHVRQTAARLEDNSRVIAEAVADGRTAVVGVSYRLDDGTGTVVSTTTPLTTTG